MTFVPLLAGHTHPTWADFGATVWVAVVVAGAIAIWTVWKAVMYTLRPGETEPDHIKRQILLEPSGLDVAVSSGPQAPSPASGADDEVLH
ncbi:MAG: hypothetical protein QNJ90_10565 [Planctomycetota bacterium]|nr:hypothetical protein [Planctomycetota bacterium]